MTFGPPGPWSAETSHARQIGCQLKVKHTILSADAPDDVVVVELCNDPDDAWFDGTEMFQPTATRDLKAESETRKFIRSSLIYDPQYRGREIADVIPFSWNVAPTDDRDEIFRWVLDSRGRPDLRLALARGTLNGIHAPYFVPYYSPVAKYLGSCDGGFAQALVFAAA